MKKIKLLLCAVMLLMAAGVSAQTYTWVEEGKSFTDGTLLYTLGSYQDANNSTIILESNEVAVSLYLTNTNTDQLTDVINGTYNYGTYGGSPAFTNLSNNRKNTLWNLSVGSSETYDGIKYTRLENDRQSRHRWQREFSASKIGTNTATSVTIPATVTGPNGGDPYDVVAIPYAGFIFPDYYTEQWRDYCDNGGTTVRSHVSTCMRGGNPYLTTVNIPNNSKLRDIGAYAFAGCTKLESIMIPKTVVSIKEAAFEMCYDLTTVTFQADATGISSALQSIGNYVFYGDMKIEKLRFLEGLISIGDYALIYNMALNEIKLPNTLESVGAHFLCDASSLTTLTVPASCTFINGAFLHGCESLTSVYMLGYARYLDRETSERNGEAFDYNPSYCKGHVNNCTFYVPENFLDTYKQHEVWRLVNDEKQNGTTHSDTYIDEYGRTRTGTHPTYGNQIVSLPGTTRDFDANKWVTAIFPKGVKNYRDDKLFGSNARFARYVGVKRVADTTDPKTGKAIRMYEMSFEIKSEDATNIPAGVVGMFFTGKGYTGYKLWSMEDETIEFTQDMTRPHAVGFTATDDADNAYIFMSGYYVKEQLKDYDFYFSGNQFWRVPQSAANATEDTDKIYAGVCRCFWTVKIDGLPAPSTGFAKSSGFFDDETTDVGTITVAVEESTEPTEVYDLSGRRIDATKNLKSGIYIVNGKKVFVK